MSDVGKVSRNTPKPFPTIRKSNDPLKPETGEVEFSQYMAETDEIKRKVVESTAETEGSIIREEERRKKLRLKSKEKENEEEKESEEYENGEDDESDDEGKFVDLEV
jgi:hypothetical protein